MNISFGAEYEAFRDEVRGFLSDNLTDELRDAQRFCPGIFSITSTTLLGIKFCISKAGLRPAGRRSLAVPVGI